MQHWSHVRCQVEAVSSVQPAQAHGPETQSTRGGDIVCNTRDTNLIMDS